MMKYISLFNKDFLASEMEEFRANSIPNIRNTTIAIADWCKKLDSGRLHQTKEESIKSQFVTSFFGDILGFNYGNANEWMLEEEKKSVVDATKVDCALGYFNKESSKVFAVVEVKGVKDNLDKKQNRPSDRRTPTQQAFDYSSKMGGECKWVIVTNIIETRFYRSNDQSKFQVFFLKELMNEPKRNELLFLFHKNNFLKKEGKSRTELLYEKQSRYKETEFKPLHIIDKLYNSIKRFEGLGFVNPEYLATIYPFNILNEYVWHYNNRVLFTNNREIYELLKGVTVENSQLNFAEELLIEIEKENVIEARQKIECIFKFLNHSLIYQISAIKDYRKVEARNKKTINFSIRLPFSFSLDEGISKDIRIFESKGCDCLICNYRDLNFNRFLGKLKAAIGNEEYNTPEYAYGNYLAASNNFKTAYSIYKTIEKEIKGKEGSEIVYFLTKYNIKYLHNLVKDYSHEDGKEIINDIKSIDLDKVIYDEIEFSVDKEVKNYLVKVKENDLIYKLQDEIEEIIIEIEKLKNLYDNGWSQELGPNLPDKIFQAYYKLYLHVNSNYIIYDKFKRYKSLTGKVFKGLITSYQTKEDGLTKLNEFFLLEAILHIRPKELQTILKEVNSIEVEDGCVNNLLSKLNNFTSSYYNDELLGVPHKNDLLKEYLNNFHFEEAFTDIFSNLISVLSTLEITKEQFQNSKKPLINYLKIETELAWFDLKEFSKFLIRKGYLFEDVELYEILNIAIRGDEYSFTKYTALIRTVGKAIYEFYPDFKIDNIKLVRNAILKCISDNGKDSNYLHLIPLVKICADNCRDVLLNTFEEELDRNFSNDLYESLIEMAGYDWSSKNYFQVYSNYVNRSKGLGTYKYGKQQLTDLIFFRYAFLVYKLNIPFEREELKSLTNLNNFETWLLDPKNFDYQNFNPKWVIDINSPTFLNRLKGISEIKSAMDAELNSSYDPSLAEIRYVYFSNP